MGLLGGAMFRKSLSLPCGKCMETAECTNQMHEPGERGNGLA